MEEGLKYDEGKQGWYPLPLEVLRPLADVFLAGEKKYKTFNCLQPFKDQNRRFYDATMRHLEACQLDPLAKDEETGCYHAAQAAFSILMRLYHCKKEAVCGTKIVGVM
uniref:dATP/dGTP diphosphohydrolase N-terminal domain-containing protein n=1 Tax=viral metagenome TaxID=1070528 RepID=A0A6M3M1G9_9ZZZZ